MLRPESNLSRETTQDRGYPDRLTPEQLGRWADRIADGRDEFPAELAEPARSALADEVRSRLRDRLLRLIAQAVASRLRG